MAALYDKEREEVLNYNLDFEVFVSIVLRNFLFNPANTLLIDYDEMGYKFKNMSPKWSNFKAFSQKSHESINILFSLK